MTPRDELARDVFVADNHRQPEDDAMRDWAALTAAQGANTYAHKIADGLIAAGYRKLEPA